MEQNNTEDSLLPETNKPLSSSSSSRKVKALKNAANNFKMATKFEGNKLYEDAIACYIKGLENILSSLTKTFQGNEGNELKDRLRQMAQSHMFKAERADTKMNELSTLIKSESILNLTHEELLKMQNDSSNALSIDIKPISINENMNKPSLLGFENIKAHFDVLLEKIYKRQSYNNDQNIKKNHVLIYGPPGCGKVSFVNIICSSFHKRKLKLFKIDIQSIIKTDKYEPLIRKTLITAKTFKPSLVLIENIELLKVVEEYKNLANADLLCNLVQELIYELETNYEESVIIVAVSTMPWHLHLSILNRFSIKFYNPPPNLLQRKVIIKQVIKNQLDKNKNLLSIFDAYEDQIYTKIANLCDRCTIKTIKLICSSLIESLNEKLINEKIDTDNENTLNLKHILTTDIEISKILLAKGNNINIDPLVKYLKELTHKYTKFNSIPIEIMTKYEVFFKEHSNHKIA